MLVETPALELKQIFTRNEFKRVSFTKQDEFSQASHGSHLPSTGWVVMRVESLTCALDTASSQWMCTFRLLP